MNLSWFDDFFKHNLMMGFHFEVFKNDFDKNDLKWLTKKTQKTPKNEIEKALQLMQKYYYTKKK